MKPQIIFHIGLEKTGTDSFQRFCKDNHKLLREYSVLYPMRNLAFSLYNHAALAACYLPYRDFSIGGVRRARSDVVRSLRKEIEESEARTVIISSEHLSSRFADDEISALASDFRDYDCRIAVVVRDHLARIRSAYSQTVISGRFVTIDEFCAELARPTNRYVRYRETIAPWEHSFGRENVRILLHAPEQNVVQTLAAALVSPALPLPDVGGYRDNRSPGAAAIEALRRINRLLARPGASKIDVSRNIVKWALLHRLRAALVRRLTKIAPDQSVDPLRLGPRNIEMLTPIMEADRRWLAEHHGVRLPEVAAETPPARETGKDADALVAAIERTAAGWLTKILQPKR